MDKSMFKIIFLCIFFTFIFVVPSCTDDNNMSEIIADESANSDTSSLNVIAQSVETEPPFENNDEPTLPENHTEIYKYKAEGTPIPFEVMQLIEELPPYCTMKQILEYDPNAYYAGENEYTSKYIISENRSFFGIDGVVTYFGGADDKPFGDIWFRVPNITYTEYDEVLKQLQTLADGLLESKVEGGIYNDISLIYEAGLENTVYEDPELLICTQEYGVIIKTDKPYTYKMRLQLHGLHEIKKPPFFWELEKAPRYGQGEKIYNELWIVIVYPGEV